MFGQIVDCIEIQAKHAKWSRLATPAGGRSKEHQREAAAAVQRFETNNPECFGTPTVQIFPAAPGGEPALPGAGAPPTTLDRVLPKTTATGFPVRYSVLGVLGVLAIGGLAYWALKKKG